MVRRPPIAVLLGAACLSTGCGTARPAVPVGASPAVRAFVEEFAVGQDVPDLGTVRSLVRAICSDDLFTRVERQRMAGWARDPHRRTAWLERMRRHAGDAERLVELADERLLDAEEAAELARAERSLAEMRRREAAWQEVYSRAAPPDYPFVLSGGKAVELRVIDGCTTAARTFAVLAKAAGIETRLVAASDLAGLRRVVRPGQEPIREVVNGHKMALVRIQDRWHLVNTNYYAPGRDPAYEIFAELDGEAVGPEMLLGRVLRLPSMQVADGAHSPRLLVTNVGAAGVADFGEHTLTENLNLAVSGDPNHALCTNPALGELLLSGR